MLATMGADVVRRSQWYESAPVPASDQPAFVNAVAEIKTDLAPDTLLARLHEIETALGRTRQERWGPRIIDLDLLAYHDLIRLHRKAPPPLLPHPRMHQRAFVLVPLSEIVPAWTHPGTGQSCVQMMSAIDPLERASVQPLPA